MVGVTPRPAVVLLCLSLLPAGTAFGQDGAPAYALGGAEARLRQAAPCFPRGDGDRELQALLDRSLRHLAEHPEFRLDYERGMINAQNQQRYIPRSDPVACAQIRNALRYYVATQTEPH